mmetsp:Transcript_23211/g.25779  ORF Transcript_23211/g.25779 Transcript_23211/m.25779 type:complete len:150 (+) Transcript_23211:133-582(+)
MYIICVNWYQMHVWRLGLQESTLPLMKQCWCGLKKIQIQFIFPGKPNPDGLMVYGMAVYSHKDKQCPYLLGLVPHWRDAKHVAVIKPLDAAKILLARFEKHYPFKPQAVLDARFMDSDFLNWVVEYAKGAKKGGVTVVLSKNHKTINII